MTTARKHASAHANHRQLIVDFEAKIKRLEAEPNLTPEQRAEVADARRVLAKAKMNRAKHAPRWKR